MTLRVDVDGNATWLEDAWRAAGAQPVDFARTSCSKRAGWLGTPGTQLDALAISIMVSRARSGRIPAKPVADFVLETTCSPT